MRKARKQRGRRNRNVVYFQLGGRISRQTCNIDACDDSRISMRSKFVRMDGWFDENEHTSGYHGAICMFF